MRVCADILNHPVLFITYFSLFITTVASWVGYCCVFLCVAAFVEQHRTNLNALYLFGLDELSHEVINDKSKNK